MRDPCRVPPPKFLLLGGSHMQVIGEAARARSIPIAGGMLAHGRFLNTGFYNRRGNDLVFEDSEVDDLYRSYLASLGIDCIADLTIPLISSIGMNVHYLSRPSKWDGLTLTGRPDARIMGCEDFTEAVRLMIGGSIDFYRDVTALGVKCFCTLPPRRIPVDTSDAQREFFPAIEDAVKAFVEQAGAKVIDHRATSLDETGLLKLKYRHPDCNDQIHGNNAFGDLVFNMVLSEDIGL